MKKLINTCRAIQTISAIIATIAIIMMVSAYEPSIQAFLVMGIIFLVSIIIAAIMSLIISMATEIRENREDGIAEKSCKAVFCNYNSKGKYLYERSVEHESR